MGESMKAKMKVERLLSTVDKGMVALLTVVDDDSSLSDFGRFAVIKNKIGVKTVTGKASSYCLLSLQAGEEIVSEGCYAISMPKLRSMLASLPKEDMVEFEFQEKKTDTSIGNLAFSSGNTNWKMPCSYPNVIADVNIDEGDFCLSIEKDIILDAVSSISFAGNIFDASFTTSNICISLIDKNVLFGATDDIRCAAVKSPSTNIVNAQRFLIPIIFLSKILKTFDKNEIKVFSGKGFVRFSQEEHSVKISLPDGADINRFPNFEVIVLKDHPFKLKVMTSKFKSIVSACHDMNPEEFLMKIDDNAVHFYAYCNKDGMSYHSSLPYTGDKVNVSVGVCSLFLLEYLKKVKEEVIQLEFPQKDGKPKYIEIQDNVGGFYLLKSLIDMVHTPPESIQVNG